MGTNAFLVVTRNTPLVVLVGRSLPGNISNQVKLFDADKSEWKEEAPLPSEFGGTDGGLMVHKAVQMQIGNNERVIYLGG